MKPQMTSAKHPSVGDLAGEVLGNLAFMITNSSAVQPPPSAAPLSGVIGYDGPHRGTLRCWCTPRFAAQLAANLLGVDPKEDSAQAGAIDAVRELLNVLCGHLVTCWYGTESVFNLSIAEVFACEGPPPIGEDGEDWWRGDVDGEPFVLMHKPAE